MDEKNFDALLESVKDLARHLRGDRVTGARVVELTEPEPQAFCDGSGVPPADFAPLAGASPKR